MTLEELFEDSTEIWTRHMNTRGIGNNLKMMGYGDDEERKMLVKVNREIQGQDADKAQELDSREPESHMWNLPSQDSNSL